MNLTRNQQACPERSLQITCKRPERAYEQSLKFIFSEGILEDRIIQCNDF